MAVLIIVPVAITITMAIAMAIAIAWLGSRGTDAKEAENSR